MKKMMNIMTFTVMFGCLGTASVFASSYQLTSQVSNEKFVDLKQSRNGGDTQLLPVAATMGHTAFQAYRMASGLVAVTNVIGGGGRGQHSTSQLQKVSSNNFDY